jgi:hypothetical protein
MSVLNGVNSLGTTATSVELVVSGDGHVTSSDDGSTPHFFWSDRITLDLIITQNTDDPDESADITRSSRFPNELRIYENESGTTWVMAYLDVSFTGPLALTSDSGETVLDASDLSVTFRLVDFAGPTEGGAFLAPNPEYVPEPSMVIQFLGIAGCCAVYAIRRWRKNSR